MGRTSVISTIMETKQQFDSAGAISALGALAQEHRIALFRLLVQAGDTGMAAGAIADALGIPPSSLSFHLAQLSKAGLVAQERRHRSIIYRADYATMNALLGYLTDNCCAGAECFDDGLVVVEGGQDEHVDVGEVGVGGDLVGGS